MSVPRGSFFWGTNIRGMLALPLPFVDVLLLLSLLLALGASTSLFDLFSFDRITMVVRRESRLASFFFSFSAR